MSYDEDVYEEGTRVDGLLHRWPKAAEEPSRCPVSRLVPSPGRPARVITRKISTRDPGITIPGSQLANQAGSVAL